MCRQLCWLVSLVFVLGLAVTAQAADPDLVGWWWFDEAGGATAGDSSGYGNNGTLMGGAGWAPGYFKTALDLDGNDGYVDVPHNETLNTDGEATVMAWINTPRLETPGQGYQGVIAKGNATARSYSLYTTPGGMHFSTGPSGAYIGSSSTSGPLPTNEWVHVCAMIVDGGHAYFVNGEEAGTFANGAVGPGAADTENVLIGRTGEGTTRSFEGLIDDARIYVRGLTQEEIQAIMTGADLISTAAGNPSPEDGINDVPRDAALSWAAGEFAAAHDVYLGTVFDDVNTASRANPMGLLVSQGQAGASYDPDGLLEIGQTYYWRIDEVNAAPDNTIFKGTVWTFTAEPLAYPIENVVAISNAVSKDGEGLENTVNGSGLNADDQHSVDAPDMFLGLPGADPITLQYEFDNVYKLHELLVWNYNVQFEPLLGFGIKEVTVETSVDGAEWTVLGDVELAQATAKADYVANTAIDFGGVAAQFVKLTVNSGFGMMGQYGLSEVRFLFIPAQAREPQPADGAANVAIDSILDWRTGRDAVSHDVYLGTEAEALTLTDTVDVSRYAPAALDLGTSYYWRIDEIQDAESWAGPVWSFSTQEYVLIEGFESYDDEDNRIYQTWIDGYGVDTNGSQVGYLESPFAETSIVNSGRQSMPLAYDNTGSANVSEATMDLGSLDIETNGAENLRLFVAGSAPAFFEAADGTIAMNAIGNDIWNNADQFRYAYKELDGSGSMIVRVDALDGTPDAWAKGGVMIRQSTEAGAVNAFIAMTGGNGGGATFQQRLDADGASVSEHTFPGNPFAPPYWVKLDRAGNAFSAYISPDGETWTQAAETVTVDMANPVLIGLAVTSHNAGQATSAAFSNVSVTGSVTGAWQIAEIGAVQPTTGNDPQPLYVALEDNAGKTAVVTNPDAAAILKSNWTEWLIPYNELSGVNLNSLASITVGVGSPNGGSSGSGMIFIDDIGYGRPASAGSN